MVHIEAVVCLIIQIAFNAKRTLIYKFAYKSYKRNIYKAS